MAEPIFTDPTGTEASAAVSTSAAPIVARPSRSFFAKRMLVALVVTLAGLWLLYDGHVAWPRTNAALDAVEAEHRSAIERQADDATLAAIVQRQKALGKRHSALDVVVQKLIGYPTLLVGLFLFGRFLIENGGELRLEGDTLHAPRHPPIPLAAITGVSNNRWERKGVAWFDYRLEDGTTGRVRIDDFIFERPPTDKIYERLITQLGRK